MYSTVYVREAILFQNINPQENEWPQNDHFPSCLIA